jgi:very-short-patch-repair endonuclease
VLSHTSAAALWGLLRRHLGVIEISVLSPADPHADGVRVHRRRRLDGVLHEYIPVTRPADTIVDMAPRLSVDALEGMISLADVLGLTTPAQLRRAADGDQRPGTGIVKRILDPYLFRLTRSKLERLFLRLCDEAGLARPLTRQWVNGYEVDFHWPDLGWVVETDGGTFHRTPMQQTEDRRRDQAHARAGLHCVRFTHWQVAYEREYVAETLAMCLAGATR